MKIPQSLERHLEVKEERKKDHREVEQKIAPTDKGKTELEKGWEKQMEQLDKQRHFLEAPAEATGGTPRFDRGLNNRLPYRPVSLRAQQPFPQGRGKNFQCYLPFGGGGSVLFGHSLFQPYKSAERQTLNRLLLVEGETNLLQIHSLG
jgi:hypothetical protein